MRDFYLAALKRNRHVFALAALTLSVWAVASAMLTGFASSGSLENLLLQFVALATVAAGQTAVITTGGIDLSTPWMMTVTAILLTMFTHGHAADVWWAVPAVLALAAAVGICNGLGVGLVGVHPIIMTLASNVILSGALVLIAGALPPAVPPAPIKWLAHGRLGPIPVPLIIVAAVALITTVLLSFTVFGRGARAVGLSPTVSRFSGVRPLGILIGVYAFSSLMSALGGIFYLGYVGVAFPGMGEKFLFASIAAVIVGGASVLGGTGNYLGTLVGAALLTLVNVLIVLFSLAPGAIGIFYGFTILISVFIGSIRSRPGAA